MRLKSFTVIASALALAACSKFDPSIPAPTLANAQSTEQIKATVIRGEAAVAPKGDPSRPLATYENLISGAQL